MGAGACFDGGIARVTNRMVVEYATWVVEAPDLDAYRQWVLAVGAQCRAEPGCLEYDYRCDPLDSTRWSLFQAWESEAAFQDHLVSPAHKEMLKGGWDWTNHDIVIRRWHDAGDFDVRSRG
jgi:quinol monooxygenase YgiN